MPMACKALATNEPGGRNDHDPANTMVIFLEG